MSRWDYDKRALILMATTSVFVGMCVALANTGFLSADPLLFTLGSFTLLGISYITSDIVFGEAIPQHKPERRRAPFQPTANTTLELAPLAHYEIKEGEEE